MLAIDLIPFIPEPSRSLYRHLLAFMTRYLNIHMISFVITACLDYRKVSTTTAVLFVRLRHLSDIRSKITYAFIRDCHHAEVAKETPVSMLVLRPLMASSINFFS